MRILLIEDDEKIASFIIMGLKQEGFAVDHAVDGNDGLHLGLYENFYAVVIDIILRGLSGLELIRELREQELNLPVSIKRPYIDSPQGSSPQKTFARYRPWCRK